MMDKYLKWHQNVLKKAYPNGYWPRDSAEWIDLLDKSHADIRDKLGGISKTYEIETGDGQKKLDLVKHDDLIKRILGYVPGYLDRYGFSTAVFALPTIKGEKNISTSKHIMGYATRAKIPKDNTAALNNLVSMLGDLWGQNKTKKDCRFATVTTSPYAFAMIGSMGCDAGSCFVTGSFNSDKKYGISLYKDSFVIIMNDTEFVENLDSAAAINVKCRSFGMWLKDASSIMVLNRKIRYTEAEFATALVEITKDITGCQSVAEHHCYPSMKNGLTYCDSGILFYPKENKNIIKENISFVIPEKYSLEHHNGNDTHGYRKG